MLEHHLGQRDRVVLSEDQSGNLGPVALVLAVDVTVFAEAHERVRKRGLFYATIFNKLKFLKNYFCWDFWLII